MLADFQVPIFIDSQSTRIEGDPAAGLAPAGFHFRDAEQPVAPRTVQLRTIPLQQVMRGTADASGRCERVQAVFAALLLIVNCPAQADQREENEEINPEEVGRGGERVVQRLTGIEAQDKGEDQDLDDFRREEGLLLEPEASSVR